MSKGLSKEKREMVIDAYERGKSNNEIATIIGCDRTIVFRIIKAYVMEGRVESKKRGGYGAKKISEESRGLIVKIVVQICLRIFRDV